MDIALNHSFGQNPMVRMYFNPDAGDYGQPTSESPWFNETPKHDFNVGYDFNHESTRTRNFCKRVLGYWMDEYHIDGYRFDLSKGFTQNNTLGDIAAWGAYDQSRVNILNDYYSHMQSVEPGSYAILEHLGSNGEEEVLSDSGMMLWGKMTTEYIILNENVSSLDSEEEAIEDKERYDAVQTGSGPESQRINQHYQNKPAGSYDPMTKHADQGAADYADRLNAVRAGRIDNNELTPGEWMQKGTNAVRKAFGGEDRPLKPARTVVDLDGPDNSPAHRYVGSDKPQWPSTQRYLDPKADAQYKARQKALFPDEFKEEKTEEGNLFTKGLEDNDVKIGDKIPGTNAIKTKDIGESIFALTNQWKAYKG
jgi:hypothetical protein